MGWYIQSANNAVLHKFAEEMLDRLLKQMKKQAEVTEEWKAGNQMAWVRWMNNIKNRAAEIVYSELVYS